MTSTTRITANTLASPIKARLTRRDAISGAAVAALGLGTGGAIAALAVQARPVDTTVLDLADRIATLALRRDMLADQIAGATDRIPSHFSPDAEVVEAETLGLPAMRITHDLELAQLDEAAQRLATLPARTPSEVAAKARAAAAVLGRDEVALEAMFEQHCHLVASALRDAAILGASA